MQSPEKKLLDFYHDFKIITFTICQKVNLPCLKYCKKKRNLYADQCKGIQVTA